jgi:hypothetical protein
LRVFRGAAHGPVQPSDDDNQGRKLGSANQFGLGDGSRGLRRDRQRTFFSRGGTALTEAIGGLPRQRKTAEIALTPRQRILILRVSEFEPVVGPCSGFQASTNNLNLTRPRVRFC